MADNPAEIRTRIEEVRHRLDHELDRLQPIVARRVGRARRLVEIGTTAVLAVAVARLLFVLVPAVRRRKRARSGICSRLKSALLGR
jgi:hypothetical protein